MAGELLALLARFLILMLLGKWTLSKASPPTTVASRLLSGGVHFRSKNPAQFDRGTCFSLFNSSTLVTLIQRLSVDAMTPGSPDVTRQRDPGSVSWLTNEI